MDQQITLENYFNSIDDLFDQKNTKILSDAIGDINADIKNFLISTIKNVTFLYRKTGSGYQYSPFVNGRYLIFMVNGPWYGVALNYAAEGKYLYSKSFNTDLSFDSPKNGGFFRYIYPMLATDIDIPEITKEYVNISMRSQSITSYQREVLISDFNISYLEDNEMNIIRYYDLWHKTIELYRRGKLGSTSSTNKNRYFYDVPYANAVWVMLIDNTFQVRALFYLPGVRPISLPLKQVIGSRGNSKITIYNIQHKGTILFYKFFRNNQDLNDQINENKSLLLQKFKSLFTNQVT